MKRGKADNIIQQDSGGVFEDYNGALCDWGVLKMGLWDL